MSANVGCVMDAYICYCATINRKMTVLDATGSVVPCYDDYYMSANGKDLIPDLQVYPSLSYTRTSAESS